MVRLAWMEKIMSTTNAAGRHSATIKRMAAPVQKGPPHVRMHHLFIKLGYEGGYEADRVPCVKVPGGDDTLHHHIGKSVAAAHFRVLRALRDWIRCSSRSQ